LFLPCFWDRVSLTLPELALNLWFSWLPSSWDYRQAPPRTADSSSLVASDWFSSRSVPVAQSWPMNRKTIYYRVPGDFLLMSRRTQIGVSLFPAPQHPVSARRHHWALLSFSRSGPSFLCLQFWPPLFLEHTRVSGSSPFLVPLPGQPFLQVLPGMLLLVVQTWLSPNQNGFTVCSIVIINHSINYSVHISAVMSLCATWITI
jgi:hypothetical protein